MDFAVNQRRSYDGNLCTIRYVGQVEGTSGDWLGVEWDNPTRGKHSGEHNGVRYFTCRNKEATPGSFVRPSRPADKPRGFLEALREKYVSEFMEQKGSDGFDATYPLHYPVKFSSKVVEEVGFDKIRKKLAELQELKIVLLDGLRVAGVQAEDGVQKSEAEGLGRERACREIEETCPKIAQLDISRCLVSQWRDVKDICARLERLRVLKLNGNRFGAVEEGLRFEGIAELHLNETLLSWEELSTLSYQFPALKSLSVSMNQVNEVSTPISETITTLILEHNEIDSLFSVRKLAALPKLKYLSLRGNCIEKISRPSTAEDPIQFSFSLEFVDLSYNKINSWSFINALPLVFPGLQSLRISGNPLYNQPVAPTEITNMPDKPMTVDEAYMLTLARLPSIQILNYGNITPQDRNNGELYYLSLIGKELSALPEDAEKGILAKHPRYGELCERHGEPIVRRAEEKLGRTVNPRSVAARLVKLVFRLSSQEETIKTKEVPRSFDTYQVKALVSRLFGLTPLEFRLTWETDELDPVSKENREEEEWDSEDEEMDIGNATGDETRFVRREVELVDSTRDIGFWLQDLDETRIRVDLLG
ncbi:putative tubulin-specific chaperone [Aspergillus chevalieri]|uniref:Leucine-rich repeat-containing protein 51 n=1 Tax=Aspergillus chevalieri TaxID=182096 RepID=A0A7R7ZIZ9_ASPCH|nr:uncharacterized protein ACHE_10238A [Aspergillus chevalieri]BCR82836.1 hypothetical protein ACHE_10238A [Aspergillus chevalieri]